MLDSDIKPCHWYIDKNGCKKLYLGVVQQIYGPPHFSCIAIQSPAYLYAKYDELKKYFGVEPDCIPIRNIAQELLFKIDHTHPVPYYGHDRHHKFLSECGMHPDGKIAPDVLENPNFTYKIAFYDALEEAKPEGRYLTDGTFVDKHSYPVM